MGRIAEAISAGRRAVSRAEGRALSDLAGGGGAQALLVPGLSEAALTRALAVFVQALRPGSDAIVIADRLPRSGMGPHDLGFEHLVPLPDLLSAAPLASVLEHQVHRLQIILARRDVAQCHWTGEEAAELVKIALQRRAARRSAPGLAHGLAESPGPDRETILRPLQLSD